MGNRTPDPQERAERAIEELERVLAGREDHADQCVIETTNLRRRREIMLEWHDRRTSERGVLAKLPSANSEPEIAAVLSALQTWRRRALTRQELQRKATA